MRTIIRTIRDIFRIRDLRDKLLNTFFYVLLFRLGSHVVLPGVDADKVGNNAQGIFGLLDTFLGGAFSNVSIFALGIMPYISASIALQLLSVSVPYFQRIQKEGEAGRRKINQYTRFLTIVVSVVQSSAYVSSAIPAEAVMMTNATLFNLSSVVILVSGTVFCMWLGERITERGIGNGISMLIMVGIVSRFPGSIVAEFLSKGMSKSLIFLLEMIILFFVVVFVIMLVQGIRKVPVQYVKQVVGGNLSYGSQRQYIPLRVNAAGVMPIIFAQSLMFVPALLAGVWADSNDVAQYIGTTFSDILSWEYNLVYALLIIIFAFFYTAITINPQQMANDMRRGGGFIPGVKAGSETAEYIDNILTRIVLPGAILLAVVAILPAFAQRLGVSRDFSQFYGGTSLLIMVGVVLDTVQQVESYLLMRHYDGLMKSGKMQARRSLTTAV